MNDENKDPHTVARAGRKHDIDRSLLISHEPVRSAYLRVSSLLPVLIKYITAN